MILQKGEMINVIGGVSISGTLLTSINSLFKTIFGIGQNLGGAIRRISSRNLCKF